MDKEHLPDFMGGEAAGEPEIVEQPAPQPEAPQPEPTPEPAPTEAPAPEPAPQAPPVAQNVPLATFLDQRDKANAAAKEAKELREWRAQQEAQAARQPPPNREDDPDGYEDHRQAQFQEALFQMRRDQSRAIAEIRHGEDTVKAAFSWGAERCDQDRHFNAKVRESNDPYGFVVAEWRREQLVSKVDPTEFEAYQQWKASQGQSQAQPGSAAPAAPPARPAAPRQSLAAAPSASRSNQAEALDADGTFKQMFG